MAKQRITSLYQAIITNRIVRTKNARKERILKRIEKAMGKPVSRDLTIHEEGVFVTNGEDDADEASTV